jgi:hypothetical protein
MNLDADVDPVVEMLEGNPARAAAAEAYLVALVRSVKVGVAETPWVVRERIDQDGVVIQPGSDHRPLEEANGWGEHQLQRLPDCWEQALLLLRVSALAQHCREAQGRPPLPAGLALVVRGLDVIAMRQQLLAFYGSRADRVVDAHLGRWPEVDFTQLSEAELLAALGAMASQGQIWMRFRYCQTIGRSWMEFVQTFAFVDADWTSVLMDLAPHWAMRMLALAAGDGPHHMRTPTLPYRHGIGLVINAHQLEPAVDNFLRSVADSVTTTLIANRLHDVFHDTGHAQVPGGIVFQHGERHYKIRADTSSPVFLAMCLPLAEEEVSLQEGDSSASGVGEHVVYGMCAWLALWQLRFPGQPFPRKLESLNLYLARHEYFADPAEGNTISPWLLVQLTRLLGVWPIVRLNLSEVVHCHHYRAPPGVELPHVVSYNSGADGEEALGTALVHLATQRVNQLCADPDEEWWTDVSSGALQPEHLVAIALQVRRLEADKRSSLIYFHEYHAHGALLEELESDAFIEDGEAELVVQNMREANGDQRCNQCGRWMVPSEHAADDFELHVGCDWCGEEDNDEEIVEGVAGMDIDL